MDPWTTLRNPALGNRVCATFTFIGYIVCLFTSYASLFILFSLFPYLSPPLLTFPLRIDPLRFQARCRKRRLNLALVFLFILCCSRFLLIDECVLLLCSVQFFSIPSQEIGSITQLRNDLFYDEWDAKTTTQSISRSYTVLYASLFRTHGTVTAAAMLENRRIAVSQQWLDRSSQNLA